MLKRLQDTLPEFLSRIVVGTVFIESGVGKFQNLTRVIEYFDSLRIPLAQMQAPFVAGVEVIAGIMTLLGMFTRLASSFLIAVMTVAIITAKREELSGFSSLTGLSEFLYIVILAWLLARGSKALSVDIFLCRRFGKSTCAVDQAR